VLINTETEVSGLAEVLLAQLKLLDTESLLQDLKGLGTTDSAVASNLLVTTNTELSDSEAS
jgi:hypothetical protein